MAGILNRALQQAGLSAIAARVLRGDGLADADLQAVHAADVLLLAGLADAVRVQFHGDEVRVLPRQVALREPELVRLGCDVAGELTGQELLQRVALCRLTTPGAQSIAVDVEQYGLQLAQVALSFGANALFGEFGNTRGLALLDGPQARKTELAGLIARAGRRARFDEARGAVQLESRS